MSGGVRIGSRVALLGVLSLACASTAQGQGNNLIVDGSTPAGQNFVIGPATARRYDHICIVNGAKVTVTPYAANGDKTKLGNLELIAGSVYIDEDSTLVARGAGYQPRQCYHGDGPNDLAGGRGGCAVWDSGGGGAHFGRGGRGTIDGPTAFPTHFEENCDVCTGGVCSHRWTGSACSMPQTQCGTLVSPCPAGRGGRFCREGPTVAGTAFWHNIYEPEFGAAGGDKGCLDADAYSPTTGGAGGGRIVVVGLSHLTNVAVSPCGANLPRGHVRIEGDIDANGKRGCGIGNDSGGGGAGGTVLIVGETVAIADDAEISARGGLGGDTHAADDESPDYQDCIAGAQTSGLCDDCGGGGGGGIISVLSVNSEIDPRARFNVSGADGGTCDVCKGEAGGGAGELQIDGAYVGEFCDGYDNDFDGEVDEDIPDQSCGLGACAMDIAGCAGGEPVTCEPVVTDDPSCSEDPVGARPRIAVVLDTSASMLLSLDGYPTFGDGSPAHPGLDVDNDGQPNDSRLHLARTALSEVLSAYPEIDFALARYHQDQAEARNCQTASWFECQHLVASYDDPTDNGGALMCEVEIASGRSVEVNQDPDSPEECINYAGSCGPPRRGADILSGFGMPVRDMVRWLDGRESDFRADATPGNVCDHLNGGDCEVRGSGPTPLAGSLEAMEDYLVPIRATDGAAECRSYAVILVTDGAESCNGAPAARAQRLHDDFGIDVHVVAVSVLPEEEASLNEIAAEGGTTEATFVTAPEQLVPALTSIIAGSIRFETCNNLDDDCDTRIDEGIPKFCDKPNGVDEPTLCEEPEETICDGEDDDCDGTTDEGVRNACGECGPEPGETCDGFDNDCDGRTDEGTDGGPCGEDEGQCQEGTLRCVGGVIECRGEVEPTPERCDCQDDDCDGTVDEDPEGNLCEDGRCIGCACIVHCMVADEFSARCPAGLAPDFQDNGECLCIEDNCDPTACAEMTLERDGEVACAPDAADKAACICRAGACTARCDGVTCGGGQICDPRNGRCVENSCRGLGCADGELCDTASGECIVDACAGVSCAAGEACRDGVCEASCAEVTCGDGERCRSGVCTEDPCAGVSCGLQVCDPASGECIDDPCRGVVCDRGLVCSAQNGGACERNPCWNVHCPEAQVCREGECVLRNPPAPKPEPPPRKPDRKVLAAGGGGFSCSAAEGSGAGSGLPALWLLGALLCLRRGARRLRAAQVAPLACAASVALAGCKVDPYCLECEEETPAPEPTAGSGANGGDPADAGGAGTSAMADAGGSDGGVDGGLPSRCRDRSAEVCNGKDDDCDFRVDEETVAEENDCDQLGVCAGTQPVCIAGEFTCRYPDAREADETRCDAADNDCDGRVDESFPELGDGCSLGTGECATAGTLVCDATGAGMRCELEGAVPEPQDELCDNLDNDCDGMTDEPAGEPGTHPSHVVDAFTPVGTSTLMYTYEASRPDATSESSGQSSVRPCSRPGVLPWTGVSYASARSACEALGYRLCTPAEWLAACEGSPAVTYPYGGSYDEDACNGADHDIGSDDGIQNGLLPTGERSSCASSAGVHDLSGNAKEWTDDPQGQVGGTTIYVVRGGSFDSPANGLTCQTRLSQQIGTTALPSLGFRCCADAP